MSGPTPTRQPIEIVSGDGERLDGEVATPGGEVGAVAVVAHPHPQYGGSRHDHVVAALADGLLAARVLVLTFDFRGVGRSTGSWTGGEGEALDLAAAAAAAADLEPARPLALCGYSFGADLALATDHERCGGWLVAAPPLRFGDTFAAARSGDRPVHVVTGVHDQFNPADKAAAAVAGWDAATVVPIEGADHFFGGRTRPVSEAAAAFARTLRN